MNQIIIKFNSGIGEFVQFMNIISISILKLFLSEWNVQRGNSHNVIRKMNLK